MANSWWDNLWNPEKKYKDQWESTLNAGTGQLEAANAQGKQFAMNQMDQSLGQGLKSAASVAGARGLSGAGGATQRMMGDVTQNVANQKAAAANQYDQNLANSLFQANQAKAAGYQDMYKTEAAKPKWYDYLLQGAGIASKFIV